MLKASFSRLSALVTALGKGGTEMFLMTLGVSLAVAVNGDDEV